MSDLTIEHIQQLANCLDRIIEYTKTQETIIADMKADIEKYQAEMVKLMEDLR